MENLERKISDALSELREDIIDDIHFAGHGEIYRVQIDIFSILDFV